jgi:dTDP-4-amino-4,6-dideoxygalactose transaminase/nucleoside-diphosphate-sugar epimerase
MAAVANGSVALEAALVAIGTQPGDRVLVPCRSFVATAMAVVRVGAVPVFCDVDAVSGVLTVDAVEAQWTSGTLAVIAVHLAGWPVDMTALCDWAEFRGVRIIEDVAQAHGGRWAGQPLGTFGAAAAWSFCQDKIMSTGGEGGMVTARCMEAVQALRDHGRGCVNRAVQAGFQYERTSIGTNLRMTGMQAAIGAAQSVRLQAWLDQRAARHAVLRDRLHGVGGLTVPLPPTEATPAWYRCILHADAHRRDAMVESLQRDGWPVSIGACPDIAHEPALQHLPTAGEQRPGAVQCARTTIALPVHPAASLDDMHRIADAVAQCVGGSKRVLEAVPTVDRPCEGRHIAVTGGGGSIGRALIPHLLESGVAQVVIIDRAEVALHRVHEQWSGDARVQIVLLDICDEAALEASLREHHVHDVIHAAAHKHVPLVEANPAEGVRNNVFGTKAALAAAESAGVERFVFMSTDKAVAPMGVMGATKRLAEQLVRASSMRTCILRCCNVLDSDGSVAETFRRSLIMGRPLELTHRDASRWFTTMDDLCRMLLQVLAMAEDGSVFVPQVHSQRRIEALAHSLEDELGLDHSTLIVTQLRAGERVAEVALTSGTTRKTDVEGLLEAVEPPAPCVDLAVLESACTGGSSEQVQKTVMAMVAGAVGSKTGTSS